MKTAEKLSVIKTLTASDKYIARYSPSPPSLEFKTGRVELRQVFMLSYKTASGPEKPFAAAHLSDLIGFHIWTVIKR